jgi:GTPase
MTGETSAPNCHIIGFDSTGAITNHKNFNNSWESIVDTSIKIMSFMDVGGDKKYSTSMLKTLMTNKPDYVMLFINPLTKLSAVTKEHFRTARALQIPMVIVITHLDMITNERPQEIMAEVYSRHAAAPDKPEARQARHPHADPPARRHPAHQVHEGRRHHPRLHGTPA